MGKNKKNRKNDDDDWENEVDSMMAEADGVSAPAEEQPKADAATVDESASQPVDSEAASGPQDEGDAPDVAPTPEDDDPPRLLTKKEKERLKKEKEKARKAEKKKRQKERQKQENQSGGDGGADDDSTPPDGAAAISGDDNAGGSADNTKGGEDKTSDTEESDATGKSGAEESSTAGLTKAQKKKLKQKEKKKAAAAAPKSAETKTTKKPQSALGKALKAKLMAEEAARKEREAAEAELRRQEEEEQRRIEEQERLEQEKREEKRRKEKEKKERLKAEGKLLTKKQKAALAKREAMRKQLEAEGRLPTPSRKPIGKKNARKAAADDSKVADKPAEAADVDASTPTDKGSDPAEAADSADDWEAEADAADDWEAEADKEDDDNEVDAAPIESESGSTKTVETTPAISKTTAETKSPSSSGGKTSTQSVDNIPADSTVVDEEAVDEERSRSAYDDYGGVEEGELRSPICVVMGHVDTGKTKILDKIRKTTVQDAEAGGITQQIGASFFPIAEVSKQMKTVAAARTFQPKVPGLLIMDTPGHESFSNLRDRGSSLCNIAVLVIDIMHGLEPQTYESIELLKKKKCPFIIALNKVDRIDGWKPTPNGAIQNCLKKQKEHTQQQFEILSQRAILKLNELGFNCALYWDNPDPRSYVSIVPTSAHTGEGIPDLLYWIIKLTQSVRSQQIKFTGNLNCTVLEVKKIDGYGTTIDVILADGVLREGDRIVLPGLEGPIATTIRSLLMPEPLKELRVKNAYRLFKSVPAANGVKIAARDLDKAVAGLQLEVAHSEEEEADLVARMATELDEALTGMKTVERGVHVQASTLGSMEALLEFLRTSKVPVSGLSIGPVHKKDVTRTSIQLEKDRRLALILAFDVPVEREAQLEADRLGIKIFTAEIIYHLFESFKKHQQEEKERLQREFANVATFPCRLEIIPDCVFNTRDPIVVGVKIIDGQLKVGTPLVARSEDKGLVDIGVVGSIEIEHNEIPIAKTGQEVCAKIEAVGDKKLLGRHFDVKDELCSKISRESIDAVKNYFKEDLAKSDWKLMVQLKKVFDII